MENLQGRPAIINRIDHIAIQKIPRPIKGGQADISPVKNRLSEGGSVRECKKVTLNPRGLGQAR